MSPKKRELNDGSALQRRYNPQELRDLFAFCGCDFERFLGLLVWLESLK